MVVPLLPTNKSASRHGMSPAQPVTSMRHCCRSQRTSIPRARMASTMTCVSSLSSTPSSTDRLSASAAQTMARLVILLEPGGWIVACIGPDGRMARRSRVIPNLRIPVVRTGPLRGCLTPRSGGPRGGRSIVGRREPRRANHFPQIGFRQELASRALSGPLVPAVHQAELQSILQ